MVLFGEIGLSKILANLTAIFDGFQLAIGKLAVELASAPAGAITELVRLAAES